MGQYTEFRITTKLKADMPNEEIDLLKRIIVERTWGLDDKYDIIRPSIINKFFDCPRWLSLLTSTDFDKEKFSIFTIESDGLIVLDIHTKFKNYDNEIDFFLDWIAPYIYSEVGKKYLGWYLHEGDDKKTFIDFLPNEMAYVFDQTAER